MKTAYGLDFAGYSTGKSSLAKATFEERNGLSIIVYRNHAFAEKLEGWEAIQPLAVRERQLLRSLRPLYMDVPIDLQSLTNHEPVLFAWQLTKRPVDFVFNALPPLADRLGSPVARLAHLLGQDRASLGAGLYETYPAASLIPMLGSKPSYKGKSAKRQSGQWIGDGGLADILRKLGIEADDDVVVNDDHFDAAVCALTGVLSDEFLLQGLDLNKEILRRLEEIVGPHGLDSPSTAGPIGYVVIRKPLPDVPIRLRFVQQFAPESESQK